MTSAVSKQPPPAVGFSSAVVLNSASALLPNLQISTPSSNDYTPWSAQKAYHQDKPEQDFNPKLYKKNENWNPPLVKQGIAELVLMDFSPDLIKLNEMVNKKAYHGSNLSA